MNTISRRSHLSAPLLLLAATLLVPGLAQAHVGAGSTHGFSHGFAHPVSGLDHLCAMLAVGLWAAQRGGKSVWLLPLTFIGVMTLGGALGMAGVAIPFVETGITASVLILGGLIAAAARLPIAVSAGLVGLFAIFHGHAHGAEMPRDASGIAYGIGFMVATGLLHAAGIGLAVLIGKIGQVRMIRLAGCAIALCGAYLYFA